MFSFSGGLPRGFTGGFPEAFASGFTGFPGGGAPAPPGTHVEYYKRLGVSYEASQGQIKKAFFAKSKIHHPDKGGDPEQFRLLKQAYEVLKEPRKREAYDKFGPEDEDGPSGMSGMPPGFSFPFGFPGGPGGPASHQTPRISPLEVEIRLKLEDLFSSHDHNLAFTRSIQTGTGIMKEQVTKRIHIPAGAPDGHVIRLMEEGNRLHRPDGEIIKGDVRILLRRMNHPLFQEQGFELFYKTKISFQAALLGCVIEVPTLRSKESLEEGSEEASFKVQIQPQQVFYEENNIVSVPGRGLPIGSGGTFGDMHILCEIDYSALTSMTMSRQLKELISEEFPSGVDEVPYEACTDPLMVQSKRFQRSEIEDRIKYGQEMFNDEEEEGDGPRVVQCAQQ